MGLLKLPDAIEASQVQKMNEAVWSLLKGAHAVDRDDRSTWPTQRPTGFQPLTRSGALDGFWAPAVCDVLAELLGPAHHQTRETVRVLMTFPQPDPWTVPASGWHFDYTPLQPMAGIRAAQVFALLGDVGPRGGGTLCWATRWVSTAWRGNDVAGDDVHRAAEQAADS